MDRQYFPYGNKSIEFLLKRTFYLCSYLHKKVDKIILACNTLSLIALPFVRLFFNNVEGVFDKFIPYINSNSVIMGSNNTIIYLKSIYKDVMLIDGTEIIDCIENNKDYQDYIDRINNSICIKDNIILACTHFLKLEDNLFVVKDYRN